MSTSLLVSTSVVSCYPVSIVNIIWFMNKKIFIVWATTWGHKIRCLGIQKLSHPASGVCWCTVLLEAIKVNLSPQVWKSDHFGSFCGCNDKTSTVCHQWSTWISKSMQGSYSATVSIGCNKQVCTHGTLWHQHYIM